MNPRVSILVAAALAFSAALASPARAERLKELVTIEGFRKNQLVGVGLVVGLDGTGDDARSPVTRRQMAQMMKNLGVSIDEAQIQSKNVAAVAITADLPPFARSGMRIDVLVSSLGNAKSLQGGTLIATPIKGADLQTYAVAQGPLSLGGFAVSAGSGSETRKNHATVGRIPNGGTVEMDAPGRLPKESITLLLKDADFTTASRIADAIDKTFGATTARVRDPGAVTVRVTAPWRKHVVHFIATLEAIEATPDAPARVVVDERTGTVIVGEHVTLGRAAIAYGGLTVEVQESLTASQPNPLGEGETVLTPESAITVTEASGNLNAIKPAATVADVARALNALGVKPRDLVSIFQALKASGALRADLEVM